MNSDLPKVLHEIAGAPMLVHAMKAGAALEPARTVIVAGHGADLVEAAAKAYDPMTRPLRSSPNNWAPPMPSHRRAKRWRVLTAMPLCFMATRPLSSPETLAAMTRRTADP